MEKPFVGFWWRFLAVIIDGIILGVIYGIVVSIFGISLFAGMDPADSNAAAAAGASFFLIQFLGFVITICYYALMQASSLQASIGKLVIGAVVTDLNGQRLSMGKSFLREICKIPSAIIIYIGFIIAAFTEKKQALHDIMAGTLVVKKRLLSQAFGAPA